MRANLHLLLSIISDKILTTNGPFGIDRSKGLTRNDVTIQATGCLVNRHSGLRLQLVNRDVTVIADLLMSRIASKKRTYCDKHQKYLFHIDF